MFNRELIESLPGIFFLYKPVDEGYKLIGWNENHVKNLGYTSSKFKNLYGHEFFTKKEYIQIDSAIETKLLTKKKDLVPYKLHGFSFEYMNEQYLVGVGDDITIQTRLKFLFNKVETSYKA